VTTSPTTATGAPRPTRPRTRSTRAATSRRVLAEPTFFERYRALIIGGAVVIGLLLVGYFLFFANTGPAKTYAATGPKYACDTLLTPGPVETLPPSLPPITAAPATPSAAPSASGAPSAPASAVASGTTAPVASGVAAGSSAPSATASAASSAAASASAAASESPSASGSPTASGTPAPAPTLRLGFTTSILGRDHSLNAGETIEYGFCPPTSGRHYNVAGAGPIRAAVYPNSAEQPPGGWVHNLEHGWVVLLYSCKNGCPSDEEMAQMQAWYDAAPVPNAENNQGCAKEALVARFDSMTTRFAVVAWGRALLTDEFNLDTAKTFAQQWTDPGSEPEKTTC
jgi:hypothetical protein